MTEDERMYTTGEYEEVSLSPDLKRLQRVFLEQARLLFQGYLDEAGAESDNFIEGLDITFAQAVEFVNDVFLFGHDGEPLTKNQMVTDPTIPDAEH